VPPPLDAGERVRQAIEAAAAAQVTQGNASERPIASPAVRRRAWELGIPLEQVRATGPAGRIVQADLDAMPAPTLAWRRPRPHARRPVRP
jgi:2-oxoisovalerate dehydrogenase E2 component (dihydrolipoyl transacylase)